MGSESNPAGKITVADRVADFAEGLGSSLKSCVKLALGSRPLPAPGVAKDKRIIIMGNGPSLRQVLDTHMSWLQQSQTMAVNFAALTDDFFRVKPAVYTIVDPHFFDGKEDPRLEQLKQALNRVDWPMTLILPRKRSFDIDNTNITQRHINLVGVEGFNPFVRWAIRHRLGMPRPRNVLIPSIIAAIWMGYTEIVIVGADHSWLPNLSVNDDNVVTTVQPHFYADNEAEKQRVATVYKGVKLHSMLQNFAVAFKAYHVIADYAGRHGVTILNATPGSFIDAFERIEAGQSV